MEPHGAMYTEYHPVCQTKMPINVPNLPNLLFVKYTTYTIYGNAFDLHVSTHLAVVSVYVCLQQQDGC